MLGGWYPKHLLLKSALPVGGLNFVGWEKFSDAQKLKKIQKIRGGSQNSKLVENGAIFFCLWVWVPPIGGARSEKT